MQCAESPVPGALDNGHQWGQSKEAILRDAEARERNVIRYASMRTNQGALAFVRLLSKGRPVNAREKRLAV